VAEVILPDGRSLNREMVREDMAWWFRKSLRSASLKRKRSAAGSRGYDAVTRTTVIRVASLL
jgi:hypothetical protein